MSLHLYRRHRRACEAGYRENSRSDELDERRKGWRRCKCVIHLSGTLEGVYRRQQTERSTWEEARVCLAALEASRSWEASVTVLPPAATSVDAKQGPEPSRVTITDAIRLYLENRRARSLAHSTFRKYVTFTKQLHAFADEIGYMLIDQFKAEDVDAFYARSTLGPRAKGKMLEWLRGFFKFAVYREWLPKSPVSPDVKPPVGASRLANKLPFTDQQLADIIKACDQLEDRRWGNRFGSGIVTGNDVKEFIWTMVYTGLRISDTALFDIARLDGNDVFLRAKKNGGDVFVWIPDWLRDRLNARANRVGPKLFLLGTTLRLDSVTDIWRQRCANVFFHADCGEEPATPHRFRHSFARILLQRGVPIADVADLLGDDEATVRKHYARWVPERQARLTGILKNAFGANSDLAGPPRVDSKTAAFGR